MVPPVIAGDRQPTALRETRAVSLPSFPEELTFPSSLADRVWYDGERRQLCYRGFMSETAFQQLCRLHSDTDYLKAVHALFHLCEYQAAKPEPRRTLRWLPAVATLSGALFVASLLKMLS